MTINHTNLTNELAIISVSGSDSTKFLQGQLTNDLEKLNQGECQFSAHLTNKGRTLASFIAYKVEDNHYLLVTTKDISDKIIPRLKMFVLRAKVVVELKDMSIIFANDNKLENNIHIPLPHNYYLNLAPMADSADVDAKSSIQTSEHDVWKTYLIDNGIPMIYAKSQDLFTPQQINYDLLGGISFTKGCYTGQEIVARTHYLGKVKRRMYHVTSNAACQIGQKIVSPQMDNQEVGFIVDIMPFKDKFLGLASIQSNCIDNAFLDLDNQQVLNIQEIKY